jgi:hypothetical protein
VRRAWAIGLALALLVPGCITFYGDEDVHVRVLVTRDVGTEVLTDENLSLPEGASAMDALRALADVETRHGGGFVHAVDGLASQYPDRKVDWFYHVDTRLAGVGAANHVLADGELVLFDYRPWDRTMHLPHVLTGLEDWPVDTSDANLSTDTYRQRQADDERDELYAHVNGSQLQLLDARGEPARTLEAPWLLAHAIDGAGEDPRILLAASGAEGRQLVDELPEVRPTGVGAAITPNGSVEVPAG